MRKSIGAVCCLAFLTAGCGGPANGPLSPDQEVTSNLLEVGELYRLYQVGKNKPPKALADLTSVRSQAANGFEALKSGKIVLQYGATLTDTSEDPGQGSSDQVLAYEKQVPETGGKVLMLNRAVKNMTAEEFKAAPKAGEK
jgi:hypothetical protein